MEKLKRGKAGGYPQLLVVAVASLVIFLPALGHQFLINWDDNLYVLNNPVIQGLTLQHVAESFTSFFMGNYSPLHMISYMVDYELWGLRASGFILTNVLLHTANGLLFYLLLKKLAGDKVWVLLAALLFLLHPVQVESVVWVSQRKNLLAMLFFLGSFLGYVCYLDAEPARRRMIYAASLSLFALALLSKSVAVVLPPVLVLYDLCYREKRGLKALLLDKVPFAAIALLVSLVALSSHSADVQGGAVDYHGGSPYATFLTMLPVLAGYLGMIFWPARLSAHYDPAIRQGIDLQVAGAGILLVLLVSLGVALYRSRRDRFFWYALFFIGLVPVSQIVPIVTLMNDRYLYFPMLGAASFLGMLLLGDREWSTFAASGRGRGVCAVALLAVALCAVLSLQRSAAWRDSITLWQDVVAKQPSIAMPRFSLGEALMQQGRMDEAILQYEAALRPGVRLGRAEGKQGRAETIAGAHGNLGNAYSAKGMLDDAIRHYSIAVAGYRGLLSSSPAGRARENLGINVALAATHCDLGVAYARRGDLTQAIKEFATSTALAPELASGHFNLGNALAGSGRLEEALRSFETAVRLSPGNPAFVANLEATREQVSRRQGGQAASGVPN